MTPASGAQIPLVWAPRHTLSTHTGTRAKTPTHTQNKLKINQFYIREGSGIIPKNKRTDQESCCKSRSGLAAAPDTMALGDFSQRPTARHGARYVRRALKTLLCFCGLSKHTKIRHIRGLVAEFCSAHFWEPWWRAHTWVYLRCVRNTSSTEVNGSLSVFPVPQKTLLLFPARLLRAFQCFKASHPFIQDQNIWSEKKIGYLKQVALNLFFIMQLPLANDFTER